MELVLNRTNPLSSFTTKWQTKWVPAILAYAKSLKGKKDVARAIVRFTEVYSNGRATYMYVYF